MSRLRLTDGGRASAGPAPPVLPTAALRVRGRVPRALIARHAIAPEDAVAFTPDPGDAGALATLRAAGVVRAVPDGRLWLDLVAYHQRDRARGRTATIWAFGLSLMVAAIAVLFYRS